MKRVILLLIVMLFLGLAIVAAQTSAMSSTNYRLDWFVPLTGSGGAASSTNYAVNFTVGQSAIGTASDTSYRGCLGFWCGAVAVEYKIYLPLVLRNA